ncbi:tyrosinase family protein [Streptomyces beihaiensis]|uniref:Tyrosinase family protein n=1 Tax=Streptomyces beihaiensis TaxID=2984495 RepID=A0ABT3TTM1_9ACTN|nr:tyrosinase family protein [Streptomyces beihaiensis]MCX3059440.1 tyrosinase family protein [Streptomyces beihaiensis]
MAAKTVRQNQRTLTKAQKRRFVDAVLTLKRQGRYDEFVRTHIEFYLGDGEGRTRVAHMAPSFLPWHRKFLLEFERALQRVDPGVSVPYWDWTVDRTPAVSLWANDFLGGNGRRSDHQVTTGPFARRHGHWDITESVTDGDFLMRDFGRPDHDPTGLPSKAELAEAMRETVYDTDPWNSLSPGGFRNKLEGWSAERGARVWYNHNRVHRWVSGHMLGAGSVNDPVFWLHHAFVDLCWSRWRAHHPKAEPYLPLREPPIGDPQHDKVVPANDTLPPWDTPVHDLLDHGDLYRYA